MRFQYKGCRPWLRPRLLQRTGTGKRCCSWTTVPRWGAKHCSLPVRFIARGRIRKTSVGPELTSTMEMVTIKRVSHAIEHGRWRRQRNDQEPGVDPAGWSGRFGRLSPG